SGSNSRHSDHVSFLVDSRGPAVDLGSGIFSVRPRIGRNHSAAPLLRIHCAARAAGTAGYLHGLRILADRNWVADRRMVWRHSMHHFGEVTHQPERIWWTVTTVGVVTTAMLWVYDRYFRVT